MKKKKFNSPLAAVNCAINTKKRFSLASCNNSLACNRNIFESHKSSYISGRFV